jgi:WD40-like Beta Propeller Repeat
VFSRERYDGPGYELAVVERLTKRVRTLAPISSDSLALRFSSDRTPVWGPDGTRIAFVRAPADSQPGLLCWTTADGKALSCGGTSTPVWAVRAWRDVSHVIVESVSGQRHDLAEIQIDSGRVRVLESDVGEATVSPNGQWVARLCRKPACGPNGWLVGPVGLPGRARQLEVAPLAAAAKRYADGVRTGQVQPLILTPKVRVFWRAAAVVPPYVALAGAIMDGLAPGETLSFTPLWLDQHGQPIQPSVAAVYATEPDVAELDSAGRVKWRHPLNAGRFVFSAGGWRADTAVIVGRDSLGHFASPGDSRRIIRDALRRWSETAGRPPR